MPQKKEPRKRKHDAENKSSSRTVRARTDHKPESNALMILTALPMEILLYILSFLSSKDLARAKLVNKLFYQVSNDNLLWKNLFYSLLPGFSQLFEINSKIKFKADEKNSDKATIDFFQLLAQYYRWQVQLFDGNHKPKENPEIYLLMLEADFQVFQHCFEHATQIYEIFFSVSQGDVSNDFNRYAYLRAIFSSASSLRDRRLFHQEKLDYLYENFKQYFLKPINSGDTGTQAIKEFSNPLQCAVLLNQPYQELKNVVDQQLECKYNLDDELKSALGLAVKLGNIEQLDYLIKFGADLSVSQPVSLDVDWSHYKQEANRNLLALALLHRQFHMFLYLYDQHNQQLKPEKLKGYMAETSKYLYLLQEHVLLDYLLDFGIKIDFEGLSENHQDYFISFVCAAKRLNLSALEAKTKQLLLSYLEKKDEEYFFDQDVDCLNTLCELGIKIDFAKLIDRKSPKVLVQEMMSQAAREGCALVLQHMLPITAKGLNVQARKGAGELVLARYYWLHKAAELGHVDAVQVLLSFGAKVDLVNHQSKTALMYAVEAGQVAVVELLLDKHNQLKHALDIQTLCDAAISNGREHVLAYLLQRYQQVFTPTAEWSKKHAECMYQEDNALLMILFEHQLDPRINLTQLTWTAFKDEKQKIARCFLEKYAKTIEINFRKEIVKGKHAYSMLTICIEKSYVNEVKLLLEIGAEVTDVEWLLAYKMAYPQMAACNKRAMMIFFYLNQYTKLFADFNEATNSVSSLLKNTEQKEREDLKAYYATSLFSSNNSVGASTAQQIQPAHNQHQMHSKFRPK